MRRLMDRKRHGFSLLELVIVVVILGIIAAIAIPRMSRGSEGAADSALKGNLAVMRNAIDLFIAEHDGVIPTAANIGSSLTMYSDKAGTDFSATRDTTHYFGPYIRSIPTLPVGANKGKSGIDADGTGATTGWVYNASTGSITANCTALEKDVTSTPYVSY